MSHKTLSFVLFLICFANTCILFTNYSHRQDINKIDDRLEDVENYLIKIRPIQDSVRDEVSDLRQTVNTIIVEMKE
jgi:HAMP domain-containing protein